ncbi:hypothetical protein [Riemerella anatipestifer]|uniref:Uncharacterized protein n=2 Tax=Riemerella anatipestifer TaxID=34085 RepID=J9R280_RIEAN|nr:hypothetical protein [Riemerella anatipestifer]AFR35909.1 hypothetical protein B739_1311 [Riemerella anatipestifer RA-CH-1]AQY21429.1 hypothetical protein AB406_0471 [Riemerella anatipestifer]AZZ58335.1 hypothetical protein AWB57_04400 [Riemerella anatipestifer]MCU7581580.1 hypothetical protein [Riemerella anatipestifer]MDD1548756.1 hypothetical protein [Riemerella anatipestifer]
MNKLQENGKVVNKVATATEEKQKVKVSEANNLTKQELNSKKEELSKILSVQSAEQRIKNLDIIQKMAEKHKFLKLKRDSLNAFMVSRDGLKEKLFIMNDNGESFEISNGTIISELLDVCSKKLDDMLQESEMQILNFQI